MQVVDLNGKWLFKGFVGEDWLWRNSHLPGTRDTRWWNEGAVPGSVHHDLWQVGQIPDPYFELNSLHAEWASDRTWVYKREFIVPKELTGKELYLHFKGVDYEAQFFLNGTCLGEHQGMFTPVEFDITSLVNWETPNLLAVVIQPAPEEQPQVGRTSKVWTHKCRMTYWWDFCPRLVHLGVWDDVFIVATGPLKIEHVQVRSQISDDLSQAFVDIKTKIQAPEQTKATIHYSLRYAGEELNGAEVQLEIGAPDYLHSQQFYLEKPKLWWPNGFGTPHLYELSVQVCVAGQLCSCNKVELGIRKIEMIPNKQAPADALPFNLVVNNQPVYIKGWNWVPMDVFYGVPRPEKLEHLVTLAQRAHVNMLRVWGGGLIEKDLFYTLCNRMGIMVWQEFVQSSSGIENTPSEDQDFIDMMVREAKEIVIGKRNHPSLVIWCGGNELTDKAVRPLDKEAPVLGALQSVVNELHPDAFWVPTSPTGPLFGNTLNNIMENPQGLHDVHGPWEYQGLTEQYDLFNRGTSLLNSEFGVEGMTNRRTLDSCIARKNQWPATKDNAVYFHKGAWWINEEMVQKCFGGIDNIQDLIEASQFLQGEGLGYAVEANRRRQFRNSGSLPWQFNEPYPNSYCTSALDYYGRPKVAYYKVAQSYGPVLVSACFGRQAWAGQEQFVSEIWVTADRSIGGCQVEARLLTNQGEELFSKRFSAKLDGANNSRLVGLVEIPIRVVTRDIFFLDLVLVQSEHKIAENRYLFVRTKDLSPLRELPTPILSAIWDASAKQVQITNTGKFVAVQVRLEDQLPLDTKAFIYFSDNCFSLLPNESRIIDVVCSRELSRLPITISSWKGGRQSL